MVEVVAIVAIIVVVHPRRLCNIEVFLIRPYNKVGKVFVWKTVDTACNIFWEHIAM